MPFLEVGNLLKGLYTATSAMIAQQRRTEMLSNNIANANTSGYKADQGSMRAFPEMLLSRIESKSPAGTSRTEIGSVNTGVYMQEAQASLYTGKPEVHRPAYRHCIDRKSSSDECGNQ